MIGYLLAYRVAHKVAYIVTSFLPYALLFFVCRGFLRRLPRRRDARRPIAVSLVLAFLVGFFFEASVGMVGFWFLEVTSLLYIVMTLNFFISGHMLPLDLLPAALVRPAEGPAVPVHGLFPGRRLPGQGEGDDALAAPAGRAALGGRSSSSWRGCCTGWGCGDIARSEADAVGILGGARRSTSGCSAAWACTR